MPTAEKATVIEQATGWYQKSVGVIFTDYRGLKVKEMQQLRANLRAKGGELHVLKNTLFRIAAGADIEQMTAEHHNGPTAVAFLFENEAECAKVLFDYTKTHKNFTVKGGYFAGRAFTDKDVEALSKLPPRDMLIAQVIGAVAAPLTNLVGVIEALYADPIRVIGAVADKVAEGSPIPAAEPAPAEAATTEVAASAAAEAAEAPEPPAEEATVTEEVTAEAAPAESEAVEATEAPTPETTESTQEETQ
ncbi:MAG: 50S ribosomal protein L10 [Fimbriimonadaceae bacterium]|nr:50S ribosomal protein L10 [Fimbriimonadaceae bacterium]